jgi:hypothetical protein
VSFDFSTVIRPLVYVVPSPAWDLRGAASVSIDVHAPSDVGSALELELAVIGPVNRHRAPAVALKPGWNIVSVGLDGDWLPPTARAHVDRIEWTLKSRRRNITGSVVFDRFEIAPSKPSGVVLRSFAAWPFGESKETGGHHGA